MAKGRSRRNREAKKPKADKKPVAANATFLRPTPAPANAPAKPGAK
jgi:hypothetical protein